MKIIIENKEFELNVVQINKKHNILDCVKDFKNNVAVAKSHNENWCELLGKELSIIETAPNMKLTIYKVS